MSFLNNLSDKKYAKYKNRLHYVYAQLYRTQIYKEYLIYKKHKNFQINDGILKITSLLKKINKYSKNTPKIFEEIEKITNKNQKRFLIYLFLKIFNSWKFLKNHGFILSNLSKYLYNISLTRVWQVKKKRYTNYIKSSFGSRKYNRRYFISKGFPMETADDVRCWLFYFKKIGKTTLALQFYKKEFLFCANKKDKNYMKDIINKFIKKQKFFKEIKFFNIKENYSMLYSFWFSFFFFINFFSTTSKKKYIFFEFLYLFYNFFLNCSTTILKIKKNNFIAYTKNKKNNYQINFLQFFLNKDICYFNIENLFKNFELCNLLLENKITHKNIDIFI